MSDKKRRNKSAGPAWARDGGPMSGPDTRTDALEYPWELVEGPDFWKQISTLVEQKTRKINAQREQILEAFVAETGCLPSECEQVEEWSTDGMGKVWYVRRRASHAEG